MILANRPTGQAKRERPYMTHLLKNGEPVCGTFRNWQGMTQPEYFGDVDCGNCKATKVYKLLEESCTF
jgi:hypothetical protein